MTQLDPRSLIRARACAGTNFVNARVCLRRAEAAVFTRQFSVPVFRGYRARHRQRPEGTRHVGRPGRHAEIQDQVRTFCSHKFVSARARFSARPSTIFSLLTAARHNLSGLSLYVLYMTSSTTWCDIVTSRRVIYIR